MGDSPNAGSGGALKALSAMRDVTLPQALLFGIVSLLIMHFVPGQGSTASARVAEILQNVVQQQNLQEFRIKALEAVDIAHSAEIERARSKIEALSIDMGRSRP